jgi:hypothetical protein
MITKKVVQKVNLKPTVSVAQEINQLHNELLGEMKTSIQKAIRIGELLEGQKKIEGHGKWLPWLKANVKFGERQAQRYINCFGNRKLANTTPKSDLTIIEFAGLLENGQKKPAKKKPTKASTTPKEEKEKETPTPSARPAGNGSRMARNDVALKLSDFDKELEELLAKYVKSLKGVTLVNETKSIADRWLKKQVLFKKAA